jgi:outer membrane protein insertion porin family
LFSTLLFATVPRICAQQKAPAAAKTSKIAAMDITGTRKFPADQIVTASGLKIGDVVTAEQIQAAADHLVALGVFSSVNYRFTPKGDAISLEFQVQEAPTVPLWFNDFPWFTDDEIASAIRQQVGLFSGESPETGLMVDEIADVLDKLLATRHIRGELTHQLIAPPTGEGMVMQFLVDEPALKIRSVQFGDSLANDSEKLKDRLADILGQPYSRFAIEVFENEQIHPLYAAKGFLRAQIGPPEGHLKENAGEDVEVLIPIAPGLAYSWNGVTWQGNKEFPPLKLDSAIELKTGDLADGMKIESLWRTIESAYANRGYLDAKLDAQPEFDDTAHRVSYRVIITEGIQYHMGELIVTGLSLDAEKKLRRAWQLGAGQVFDNGYFENLLRVLSKPSAEIFGEMPVHYNQCGHWLRPETDKHTVDVLLDFK